jgi:outer membrane protein
MKKLFLIPFLVFTFTARAQGSSDSEQANKTKKQALALTLEQAIAYALLNNYSVINANRDIDASKEKKRETTALGLPQINAGLDYLNNFEFTKQGVTGGGPFGGKPGQISTIVFGTKHTMISKVTLSQLIFDGSYVVALQASKAYLQFFENAKKKTNSEVREMVINSYGNVLLAEESIKILESNKAILEKNYNDIDQIYKNGLAEEESVEQIAITLASVKSSLNNVKRLKNISIKMLKLNLGIEINEDLKLTDNLDELSKTNLSFTFTNTDFKIDNSIDYQIASSITNQKRLLLKLEKSKVLPSLGAAVNFGYNSFENDFKLFSQRQKWNNFSNL